MGYSTYTLPALNVGELTADELIISSTCSCTEVLSDMYLNAAGHGWKRSERADVAESCTGFKRMQSGDVQQLAVAELLCQICQRKLIWKNQHEKRVSHSLFVRHLWHPVHVWEQIQKNNGQ